MLGSMLPCPGSGGASSLALCRRHGRLAFVAIVALVAIFWVGSSLAVASSQPHAFLVPFGSAGTGVGQFELAGESGVAVDQSTGDVYVGDTGNHRVDEFTASGVFVHAFGWGVANGADEPQTCKVTCLVGLPGAGPGQFERPTFLAVDNTLGGGGDLYVADNGSVANARQRITVNASGSYALSYASFVHATTTGGSPLVTAVSSPWGVGDPISGTGIPSGSTIARSVSPNSFELSTNATVGGRAVLTVTRATTAPINHNAPANKSEGEGSVEAALGAVAAIGENGVGEAHARVTGKEGGPYTVEFVENLAATNVPRMTAVGTAAVTVAIEVEGKNTARVQKFDPAGILVTGWGGTPALGELDGTSCTECGDNPHFGEVYGVGVKPDGKLLVLDLHGIFSSPKVSLFEGVQTSGDFIEEPPPDGGAPIGVALDPAGRLYLGSGNSRPPFEALQTSHCDTLNSLSPCFEHQPHPNRFAYHENFRLPGSSPAVGVAVDPSTEDVYVAQFNPFPPPGHSDVVAYDTEGNVLESSFGGGEIKTTHEKEITEARGIAASGFSGSKNDVYVADPGAGRIEIFAPGGNRDALTVSRAGTSLGSVGSAPAGIACPSTCSTSLPAGEEVTLSATAPEHSSFVGWSGGGCSGTGPCRIVLGGAVSVTATFAQDRPVVTTGAARAVTRHRAMLVGTVDPEGDASSCGFEFGMTSIYGAVAPCVSHPGGGVVPVAVSSELWDLTAAATYHYRLLSANTGGTTYGADQTFTTTSEDCASNTALCPPPPPIVEQFLNDGLVSKGQGRRGALTSAERLARALAVCRKQKKRRSVRVNCEKQAKRRYAPAKKVKKSVRNRKRG